MNKPMKSSAGDGVSDTFPAGLRVLVVDDDPTCLMILEKMLRNCQYEVTKCSRAETALSQLRENRNGFDIVISDVHMPDMDGFKLLEHVGLEMDLPVIMMSADDSKNVVMKGVTHGACDYLIKPVRIEALKNIWQHVVRKRRHEWKDFDQSGSKEDGDSELKPPEDADNSSSTNEGNWKNAKRRKDEEDEAEERDDTSTLKKPRVVWSVELHQQFVAAVNQLGIDKAVPKKILELMNVPGLTRENVASHLQKYRLYLRRLSGVSQHQNGLNNNSFVGNPESTFRSLSSLNGIDLQALAATGQISTQNLAALRAAALSGSTAKSGISMPLIDQRNLFSFETPNNSKQINLLHGIPTSMQSKQLANFHQPSQSFGGMNMQGSAQGSHSSSLLAQTASRPQIMNNDANSNHLSRIPSSFQQPTLSNGMASASAGLMRNGIVDSARIGGYNSISQAPPVVDFSINQNTNTDFPGNSFPLGNSSGMSTIMSKRMLQAVNSDIFQDVNQNKPQNWDLPNVGVSFDASQHANIQGSLDVIPSVLVHEGFSTGQNCVQNGNTSINPRLSENSFRVKAESLLEADCQNPLFPEQFGQEDLMSALLKQEQEGIGPVFNEFGFDGFPLDNLPV